MLSVWLPHLCVAGLDSPRDFMLVFALAATAASYHGTASRMPAPCMASSDAAGTVAPLPVPEIVDYLNNVALTMAPAFCGCIAACFNAVAARMAATPPALSRASSSPILSTMSAAQRC